jgi:hypothetical protein
MEAHADLNGSTPNTEVDIEKYATAKKLVNTCRAFFSKVDNLSVNSCPSCSQQGLTVTGHLAKNWKSD